MAEPEDKRRSDVWFGLAGVGAVVLAIGCCGLLPIAVALSGTIAVGTMLGIGAAAVALIVVIAVVVARARRRAACETPQRLGQRPKSSQAADPE